MDESGSPAASAATPGTPGPGGPDDQAGYAAPPSAAPTTPNPAVANPGTPDPSTPGPGTPSPTGAAPRPEERVWYLRPSVDIWLGPLLIVLCLFLRFGWNGIEGPPFPFWGVAYLIGAAGIFLTYTGWTERRQG